MDGISQIQKKKESVSLRLLEEKEVVLKTLQSISQASHVLHLCISLTVRLNIYVYIDSEVAIRLSVRRHFKRFSYEFLERYERTHYGFTACRIWQQSFVFGKYIYC